MSGFLVDVLPWTLTGDPRQQRLYLLSLVCLAAGTALCLVALRVAVLDVVAVGLVSAGAAAWLLSNGPAEGRSLVELLPGNGLTVADLGVLPAAALCLALCLRRLRTR